MSKQQKYKPGCAKCDTKYSSDWFGVEISTAPGKPIEEVVMCEPCARGILGSRLDTATEEYEGDYVELNATLTVRVDK